MRLALLFLLALPLWADISQPFTITERGAQARTLWPSTTGVPIPEAWAVTDAANLMVTDAAGTRLPAQLRVMARWRGAVTETAKPIKWLLVDIQATVGASSTATYYIKTAAGDVATPPTLTVTSDSTTITVDTGVATFIMRKDKFVLFDSVVMSANTIIDSSATKALYMVESGTTYSSALAAAPTVTTEASGPMRAQFRFQGYLSDGATTKFRHDTRLYFHAGTATVKVLTTIVFDQDMTNFFPSDMGYSLPLTLASSFNFRAEDQNQAMAAGETAYLVQRDWNIYKIQHETSTLKTGTKSAGWVNVSDTTAGVTVSKRWIWQEYPFEAEAAGKTLRLHFWPIHADLVTLVRAKELEALNSSAINQIFPYRASENLDLRVRYERPKSIAASPTGIVRTSNVVTVTTTSAHTFEAGSWAKIASTAGCGTSPNGTFIIASVPTNTTFTFVQAAPDQTCGGGTATSHDATISGDAIPTQNAIGIGKTYELDFDFHLGAGTGASAQATRIRNPLMLFDAAHFAGSKAFGNIGPRSSGLPANDLVKQVDDILTGGATALLSMHETYRALGMFPNGDMFYDSSAVTNRFWLANRHDWNAWTWVHYARTGDWTTFDQGEQINRHIGDVDHPHLTLSGTDSTGSAYSVLKGGMMLTHEIGIPHWNRTSLKVYVDDDTTGIIWHYYLSGYDHGKDLTVDRADTVITAPITQVFGARTVSHLSTPVLAYEATGTAGYKTYADSWVADILAGGYQNGYADMAVTGQMKNDPAYLGWTAFCNSWAFYAIHHYWDLTQSAEWGKFLVRWTRGAMAMGPVTDAVRGNSSNHRVHGGSFGLTVGDAYAISSDLEILKAAKARLYGFLDMKRELVTVTNAGSAQENAPWMIGVASLLEAIRAYGAYTALATPEVMPVFIRLDTTNPQSFYFNEASNQAFTVKWIIENRGTNYYGFDHWVAPPANIVMVAYNPSGVEVASRVITPADVPIRWNTMSAGGIDNRIFSLTIPSDGVTGIYRVDISTTALTGNLSPQVALISSTLGNGVWHAKDDTISSSVNCGVLYFTVPSSVTQFKIGGRGSPVWGRPVSVIQPDGTSRPNLLSAQTIAVSNQWGMWAINYSDSTASSATPRDLRVAGTKPLFAPSPGWWFDVPAVSVAASVPFYALTVNLSGVSTPTITTTTLPGGTTGVAYSQALSATSGTVPYAWDISAGALPDGLGMGSGTGIISGTPTVANTFNFTVRVTDANAETDTQILQIVIVAPPNPVVVTTASLPGGTVGSAYSQALAASGGTPPYTWNLSAGALPDGLGLVTGTITGIPTTAGTVNFTVRATDSLSESDTQALSIAVLAGRAPMMSGRTVSTGRVVR